MGTKFNCSAAERARTAVSPTSSTAGACIIGAAAADTVAAVESSVLLLKMAVVVPVNAQEL